jgi:hypothetical protein
MYRSEERRLRLSKHYTARSSLIDGQDTDFILFRCLYYMRNACAEAAIDGLPILDQS